MAAGKKNGGVGSRLGKNFYDQIEKIKDVKLRNGTARERISTEKITNLIIKHKYWKEIFSHIAEASEEEVELYGL